MALDDNGWHQVKFPENLGVWQFKLAMWEVGGIKIERTRARNIFLSKSRMSAIFFLGIFGDFWGREPRLYSEISDFQVLHGS